MALRVAAPRGIESHVRLEAGQLGSVRHQSTSYNSCTEVDMMATNSDCRAPIVKPACYFKSPANWFHIVIGLFIAVWGVLAWLHLWTSHLCCLIIVINIYTGTLLVFSAIRSDGYQSISSLLPNKLPGLVLLASLFIGLVFSFAAKFIESHQVCHPDGGSCITVYASSPAEVRRDALYFSLVTATTVGYGDYAPVGNARCLAAWEICSSLLLMVLAFPVLVSRMANW
jgi:hypothetical protein